MSDSEILHLRVQLARIVEQLALPRSQRSSADFASTLEELTAASRDALDRLTTA